LKIRFCNVHLITDEVRRWRWFMDRCFIRNYDNELQQQVNSLSKLQV